MGPPATSDNNNELRQEAAKREYQQQQQRNKKNVKTEKIEDDLEPSGKMPSTPTATSPQPKTHLKQQHNHIDDQTSSPPIGGGGGTSGSSPSPMRRALRKLNRKRWLLGNKLNESWQRHSRTWEADMEFAERQVRVETLDLFRYALFKEKLAFGLGVIFMFYAASWQPISVFILAIMASLMGQYTKQTSLMLQLNNSQQLQLQTMDSNQIDDDENIMESEQTLLTLDTNDDKLKSASATTTAASAIANSLSQLIFPSSVAFSSSSSVGGSSSSSSIDEPQQQHSIVLKPSAYDSYGFLAPIYSFVTPLFDSLVGGSGSNGATTTTNGADEAKYVDADIGADINQMWQHESRQFLRKSFEINGSAFLLALTQLASFFVGMTLITWAAKKQSSRIKILYFRSCLNQEVTWFEAIDSASGSGSSLNALVDKFEDGIGTKLALLCYFLGHVGLFALTAFSQMFNLAAFCMPFVLLVGLIIIYLSDWQAVAIGEHAMFAKRSLQLAEEIISAIRTVFAFNGQQKEITRFNRSLQPVYRKSLMKHLYTALNTSLSKFSIFACFAAYCFYAMRLFPPFTRRDEHLDKATVLAVMRGAEVSIVNILISIPFMEALQQSKGSIARIYAAIGRRSKIDPSSERGAKPLKWEPSISFRMVQFGYADRSGPTRRRSTLPYLNLPGSLGGSGGGVGGSPLKPKFSPDPTSELEEYAYSERRRSSLTSLGPANMMMMMDPNATSGATSGDESEFPLGGSQMMMMRGGRLAGGRRRSSSGSCVGGGGAVAWRPPQAIKRMLNAAATGPEAGYKRTCPDQRILSHFNLDIRAGQSVALVGPSGSGKSTVLALVQRLYDINGGQLFIGQHNIKDLSVGWLRQQIGVVTQEPRLFDLTIEENIRLGLPDNNNADTTDNATDGDEIIIQNNNINKDKLLLSSARRLSRGLGLALGHGHGHKEPLSEQQRETRIRQQVLEASKAAGAHEFISRLPMGYETRVGSGGVQLSGGQKQRIAIARALIRKPKILLLDESTSALDTESEAHVQAALRRASLGRTTLTVAHRLSTIKHADLIVVMNQGQLVECGSHEELMKGTKCPFGIYRQMYQEQSSAVNKQNDVDDNERKSAEKQSDDDILSNSDRKLNGQIAEFVGVGGGGGEETTTTTTITAPSTRQNSLLINASENISVCSESFGGGSGDAISIISTDSTTANAKFNHDDVAVISRPSGMELLRFLELPKWSSISALLVCLIAGLILPMNLIAHSYLFSAFAYQEPEQIGDYLRIFGLLILSFSSLVFVVSFLQVILPGYVGEQISTRLRLKTMASLLSKPVFYFDYDTNSAGSLCDRFNTCISNIQNLAGTRVATMIEAISTLTVGAFYGFGQNLRLSLFCLGFALLVLITTIIESRIVQMESSLQQKFDAQLAHLMVDALSNIKTIASLNKEKYFIDKFSEIIGRREVGLGSHFVCIRIFLMSLKFVMPAMSWSASMYYGCHLLVDGRIDLQTIFIVCPVVLFAVNDTFRALVFLPELLKARKSIESLYLMNREFSPEVLQFQTLGEQLDRQQQLHQQHTQNKPPTSGACPTSGLASIIERDDDDGADADSYKKRKNKDPLGSISFIKPQALNSSSLSSVISVSQLPDPPPGSDGRRPSNAIKSVVASSQQQQQQQQQMRANQMLRRLPHYMEENLQGNGGLVSQLNSLVPQDGCARARGQIQFKGVHFAYPQRPEARVLQGLTFGVAPGETLALVGCSGSGKSTCAAILEKFYDFQAGSVSIDGYDLRLLNDHWVRSQIGLVMQEPTLLSFTIGDNIRYGDNGRHVSMEEVVRAAREANIHDFIMSLPDQYDTQLSGSSHSGGCQLSGGQRQRIAIARALISNAPILIFDEATSALDSRNETLVQDALDKARKGRTSVIIAHRLASIRDADRIVVLRDGHLVEAGKHEDLLKIENGHYRALWQRQEGANETVL